MVDSRRRVKVGPNDPCPCRSGRKYKKCCQGSVDWETLLVGPMQGVIAHLSIRGKNLFFLTAMADALQLDNLKPPVSLGDIKRAFTPAAVRRIFEAVQAVWLDGNDLKRVLIREASPNSGLYVGAYEPDLILRGVTRHSLYADRILLVDPFPYPSSIRDEYNPLLHPEQHRLIALRWFVLWSTLSDWIDSGLVGFVRAPGDFYPNLQMQAYDRTRKRYEENPELAQLVTDEVADEATARRFETYTEQVKLGTPDEAIRQWAREQKPELSPQEIDDLLSHVKRRREEHPYFLEPLEDRQPELLQFSTGTNYEMAKLIALHTGSFLMTDIRSRWREIELDRKAAGIDSAAWSPFAKAFQGVPFNYLNSIPLPAALTLRREGRLESLRTFLGKVWRATSGPEPFDEGNIPSLTAELEEQARLAEVEWSKIDRDLLKWFGTALAAGVGALGSRIAAGNAEWLAAGFVLASATQLGVTGWRRREYALQYPAGFFVKLREAEKP